MSTQYLLEASDLQTGWNGRVVSVIERLALSAGDCVVLGGPNGAGKSTIVKALARQISPMRGTLQLKGRNFREWSIRDFARVVGYVPQSVEIFRKMTVEEWVFLGRNAHQQWWSWQASPGDRAAVDSALALTGLIPLRHKFMDGLSGGERQRATIAMALAQEPELLLLDEPSAHLDFRHQLELAELLTGLVATKKMAILIVLHDLNLIARIASHVVFLRAGADGIGKEVCNGTAADTLQPEVLRKVYDVEVSILPDTHTGFVSYLPVRVACAFDQ